MIWIKPAQISFTILAFSSLSLPLCSLTLGYSEKYFFFSYIHANISRKLAIYAMCKLDKPLNPFPSFKLKPFLLLNCATNNWYESFHLLWKLNLILASVIIQSLTFRKLFPHTLEMLVLANEWARRVCVRPYNWYEIGLLVDVSWNLYVSCFALSTHALNLLWCTTLNYCILLCVENN